MWPALFSESPTKYFPRCRKQCFAFLGENILKGILLQSIIVCSNTKPWYHSLSIFCFGCLKIYPTTKTTMHFLRHGESSYQLCPFTWNTQYALDPLLRFWDTRGKTWLKSLCQIEERRRERGWKSSSQNPWTSDLVMPGKLQSFWFKISSRLLRFFALNNIY